VAYPGLYSRDASAVAVQSFLLSSQRGGYPFDSDVRRAPERQDCFARVGIAPTSTQAVTLGLGRPMLPLLVIGRVPPSEAELLHVQYLRAQALMRIQHQRRIIADLRTSLLGPSASVIGSRASGCHGSLNRNSSYGNGANRSQEGPLAMMAQPDLIPVDTTPMDLPVIFAQPTDSLVLTEHQALLRQQIELFRVTQDDVSSPARGRNKRIEVGQVGICCRHCAHVKQARRTKGSVYFPATIMGLYQAAQNMSSNHIQCGLCPEMPESLKDEFTNLIPTKARITGAGRMYWAESAERLGIIDTDQGIRFMPRSASTPLCTFACSLRRFLEFASIRYLPPRRGRFALTYTRACQTSSLCSEWIGCKY
jgi:hypothetical protein